MGLPEEDLPQFPVAAAEALAGELDRIADALEQMIDARGRAGRDLPEFRGGVADQFRLDLDTHARDVAGVLDELRGTASRLRSAIDDHRTDRRRLLALVTT
jgi:hypothetical protein